MPSVVISKKKKSPLRKTKKIRRDGISQKNNLLVYHSGHGFEDHISVQKEKN
jgi:hypothetical protein